MTIASAPSFESEVGTRPSVPLSGLPLLPPGASAAVPSKTIRPLLEHELLPAELALVIDAAQADIAINSPVQRQRLATPVGHVVVANLRVLTAMIMVAAFNLRDAAARKRHVATERRAGRPWYPDFALLKPEPSNIAGCMLEIDSRAQLDYWLRWERQRLVDPNLRKWIAQDTVLDPTLIMPIKITSPNGDSWALVAMDGSRRVTNSLDAMRPAVRVDPSLVMAHCTDAEALRHMTTDDVKRLRRANMYPGTDTPGPLFPDSKRPSDVQPWLGIVSDEVANFHRARTMPANVIIGFEPFLDDRGNPMGTITDAVDSLLRQKHVQYASPKEWSRSDNSVLIGTRALARLESTMARNPVTRRQEAVLDDAAAEVFSGRTTLAVPPDGSTGRFRDPLHALASLAAVLGSPALNSAATKAVLTTLGEWRQPGSPKSRALIAADMAVHIIDVPEKSVSQVVAALAGLLQGREFRDPELKLADGRTWHHLLDADLDTVRVEAAAELQGGALGPWSVLLAMYGGIALIVNPDATSDGPESDRLTQSGRGLGENNITPDAIVRLMVETVEGQRLLADSADQVAHRLAYGPSAPTVALVIHRDGEVSVPLSEATLRQIWAPEGRSGSAGGSGVAEAEMDRTTRFQLKCQGLVRQAQLIVQEVEEIERMQDESGKVLLHARGLDQAFSIEVSAAGLKLMGFAALGSQVASAQQNAAPSLESVEHPSEDDAQANDVDGE